MGGIDDREYHKTAPVPSTGRPSMYECRQPLFDLGAFLAEELPVLRDARVLDAGCGPGAYVGATLPLARDLVALDIAHNRLLHVDLAAERVCGDVQALPFGDGTFDAAMAMHMLYHVPDIEAAVRELRRVVRDGGVLYAFTNSERAQWELDEVLDRNGCEPAAADDERFCNENGADLLRAGFSDVTLREFTDSQLVVTDPEVVVDEVERLRYLYEPGLRSGVEWTTLVDGVRRDATDVIAREGAFVMSECHGLFTCR
jgi:SAM-dependent methyltransferase